MAPAFDKCKERPAQIDTILNGLDRYNPETTEIFRDYVNQQCEEKFFDVYSCLALLKLYVDFFLKPPDFMMNKFQTTFPIT
jgi:translation initiation factor 3 subunit K